MSMFSLWLVNGVHFLKRRTGHFCLGLMATEKHYKSDSNSVVHYVYTWGTPRKKWTSWVAAFCYYYPQTFHQPSPFMSILTQELLLHLWPWFLFCCLSSPPWFCLWYPSFIFNIAESLSLLVVMCLHLNLHPSCHSIIIVFHMKNSYLGCKDILCNLYYKNITFYGVCVILHEVWAKITLVE